MSEKRELTAAEAARLITMTEAARLMKSRSGRAPCVHTVRRWANPKRGCRPGGDAGPRIVLRSIKLGGDLFTMPEWVEEFEAARRRYGEREIPAYNPGPTMKQRERQKAAANEFLRREGVIK